MSLEYAVRPFQSRDSAGRTIIPSTPTGVERATLTWGSTHAASGTLPTPKTMGTNTQCCKETMTQDGAEASGASVLINGPDAGGVTIPVQRSDVVQTKKQDKNECDDWLKNNSYVAAGIIEAFSEMASLIHASDGAFLPTGSTPGCTQKTTYKY